MKKNMTELLNAYVENAIIQGDATLTGDYKANNKATHQLIRIYNIMECDTELATNILTYLLTYDNINVKLLACAHALGLRINIDQALSLLKEISAMPNVGILGFNAEMCLKKYKEQGYLIFYQKTKPKSKQ